MEKKCMAAFDFDGTVTTKDTLMDFLTYTFGYIRFSKELIVSIPRFAAYKLDVCSNETAKQCFLSRFIKGMNLERFNTLCASYTEQRLPNILNDRISKQIQWHKQNGHRLIIVSASPSNWILPWATSQGFECVISTELENLNGTLTGRFSTKNCYAFEKKNRLLEKYPNRDSYTLYVYGDSKGDRELLELADIGWYKNKFIKT